MNKVNERKLMFEVIFSSLCFQAYNIPFSYVNTCMIYGFSVDFVFKKHYLSHLTTIDFIYPIYVSSNNRNVF